MASLLFGRGGAPYFCEWACWAPFRKKRRKNSPNGRREVGRGGERELSSWGVESPTESTTATLRPLLFAEASSFLRRTILLSLLHPHGARPPQTFRKGHTQIHSLLPRAPPLLLRRLRGECGGGGQSTHRGDHALLSAGGTALVST